MAVPRMAYHAGSCGLVALLVTLLTSVAQQIGLLSAAALSSSTNISDAQILLQFKASITADPHGSLDSWKAGQLPMMGACESWTGVACDAAQQRVVKLDLADLRLSGSISPSLGLLTALASLNLSYNSLTGPLPSTLFSNLSSLLYLDFSYNLFTGFFAPYIPLSLTYLDLSYNQFTHLPDSIWRLPNLTSLYLSNPFENAGDIVSAMVLPAHLSFCSLIRDIWIADISLTGDLSAMDNCTSLKTLVLNGTKLSGTSKSTDLAGLSAIETLVLISAGMTMSLPQQQICPWHNISILLLEDIDLGGTAMPASLALCSKLQLLSFSNTGVGGSVPGAVWELSELSGLVLSAQHGELAASLPDSSASFASCGTLQYIEMSGVNLNRGVIPSALGSCTGLQELAFISANLSGPIPASLGNLNNSLQVLALGDNKFYGSIPRELGALGLLQYLSLYSCNLSGLVPAEIGNCSNLVWLDFGWNPLNGNIPGSLSSLPNLQTLSWAGNAIPGGQIPGALLANLSQSLLYLNLQQCSLRGTIPVQIQELHSLQRLDLGINLLEGPLPQLSHFPQLQTLNLGTNKITGSISDKLSIANPAASQLINLYLDHNNFTGPIPSSICMLTSLQTLYMNQNSFEGSIPAAIGNCTSLQDLNLGDNALEGEIPAALAQLTDLQQNLILSNNALSGPIPPAVIANLRSLKVLDLSQNLLSGEVPTSALQNCSSLATIRISQNLLSGRLDKLDLAGFPNLLTFKASQNGFEGGMPAFNGSKNLQMLDLGANRFEGGWPAADGHEAAMEVCAGLGNLRVLVVRENNLSGQIPRWIWNLTSLQVLDLSRNNLVGSMPSTLGVGLPYFKNQNSMVINTSRTIYEELPVYDKGSNKILSYVLNSRIFFDVSSNQLEGHIPSSMGELMGLTTLNLSRNLLHGNIPPTLGNLKALESLDLSHNSLQGSIPTQIAFLDMLGLIDLSYNNLSGSVPIENNFYTRFDNLSFLGNPSLCGPPLSKSCNSSKPNIQIKHADSSPSLWQRIKEKISIEGWLIGYFIVLVGTLVLMHTNAITYLRWGRNVC